MLDLCRELGTHVFQLRLPVLPLRSMVVVGDHVASRAILTDPRSTKPLDMYRCFRGVYGGTPTLFTENGAAWHAKRKEMAPAFSSNRVRRMSGVAMEKTEAWIRENAPSSSSSADESGAREASFAFDPSKEMIQIVLSALSKTAFEYEMSRDQKEMFSQELKPALIEFLNVAPMFPLRMLLARFVTIPERRRAEAAAENLKALTFEIMEAYKEKDKEEPSTEGTIIQLIMDSKEFPTQDDKAAQLLEFLVAGHDTTAYSIAFILIELAKHPKEQAKLRESLSQLSPENWSSSKCLQHIVKEGMRLLPVGRSLRETVRDVPTSKKNEVIPRGSICVLHNITLFRNGDVFEDPDLFLPSRWEDPSREMLDSFHPFSLGKQNCIGQSLARAEIFGIVARICSEFELSVEEEGRVEFYMTLKPVGSRLRARRL